MTETAAISTAAPGTEPERRPALSRREVRAAIHAEAGLYVVGGLLCSTALLIPHVRAPEAVAAVGVNAMLVAAGAVRGRPSANAAGLALAFAGDLWGVVLIAVLCASAGGASSPFALIYLFAIGHAAGFQPRGRYIVVSVAALVAFLLPLAYENVPETFGAVALRGHRAGGADDGRDPPGAQQRARAPPAAEIPDRRDGLLRHVAGPGRGAAQPRARGRARAGRAVRDRPARPQRRDRQHGRGGARPGRGDRRGKPAPARRRWTSRAAIRSRARWPRARRAWSTT